MQYTTTERGLVRLKLLQHTITTVSSLHPSVVRETRYLENGNEVPILYWVDMLVVHGPDNNLWQMMSAAMRGHQRTAPTGDGSL